MVVMSYRRPSFTCEVCRSVSRDKLTICRIADGAGHSMHVGLLRLHDRSPFHRPPIGCRDERGSAADGVRGTERGDRHPWSFVSAVVGCNLGNR